MSITPAATTAPAQFAEQWVAAWNSARADAVAALCSEAVTYVDPVRPAPLSGRDEVADFVGSLLDAFPGLQVSPHGEPHVSLDGTRVILPVRVTGTMTGSLKPPGFGATGGPVVIDAHHEWELRDSLVHEFRALYDVHEVARQIGAGPPPGSRMERLGVRLQRLMARGLRRRNRR